jgi:GNAT superfamily N-acetyltransferase
MGRALEQGVVRRLSVFDQDSFTQHLLRLDADTRHLRFGMIASDQFIMEYAKGCARWDVVIYGYFIDGILRGAAELRPLSGDAHDEAEAAFSVESGLRGHGIGSKLFEKIIRAARNRGHKRLYMSCVASNRAMQALARKFAAEITFDQGGTMGVITPPHRDMESMTSEASDDAAAYAFATLDVATRSFSDPLGWFNN